MARTSSASDAPHPAGATSDLRTISNLELLELGMKQVAYVREVVFEGEAAFAIHAADGTPMALAEDHDSAVEAIIDNELTPTWLH